MFPGIETRLSEESVASTTTIQVAADLVRLTGSTSVSTIKQHGTGMSGIFFLVPVDGTITLLTTGNIAISVIAPQSRVTVMVFSKTTGTWYPGAIS